MQAETAKIFHSGLEGESFFLEKVRCSLAHSVTRGTPEVRWAKTMQEQ
jgi:hypothetical protein